MEVGEGAWWCARGQELEWLPEGVGIGDAGQFYMKYCLACGQIQGDWSGVVETVKARRAEERKEKRREKKRQEQRAAERVVSRRIGDLELQIAALDVELFETKDMPKGERRAKEKQLADWEREYKKLRAQLKPLRAPRSKALEME